MDTTQKVTPEQIKRLVQTSHAVVMAYAKERAYAELYNKSVEELKTLRRENCKAAKDVWLNVTVEDKAKVMQELWPMYSVTWKAFQE